MNKFTAFIIIIWILGLNDSLAQYATLESTFKLHTIGSVTVPYQYGHPVPSYEKQNRFTVSLAGNWKKERFAADDLVTLARRDATGYNNLIQEGAGRHLTSFDATLWSSKSIPSVENTINDYPTVPEFYEDGVWYRYEFDGTAEMAEKYAKLMFYSVNYVADVWLNDTYLGWHEGGYTPFAFDVSEVIKSTGKNVLIVRVDNPKWGTRIDIVPYTECDWFNYTGIIHDVYLEFSDKLSISRANITPLDTEGNIKIQAIVNNKNTSSKSVNVKLEIFEAAINSGNIATENSYELIGNSVAYSGTQEYAQEIPADSAGVVQIDVQIQSPKLWTPKEPSLYIAKLTTYDGDKKVDEFTTQFGIRKVELNADQITWNGKPIFFTGIARHEDHPSFGRSLPKDTIYQDLLKVKGVNANMLRTAHYPNHPYTYLISDRLGLAINEEIPVWWFNDALAWSLQNSARNIHTQMFREMVFRDYNRPSIFLWSLTNESKETPNRKKFISAIKTELNANYKDGRLITQSAAADNPGAEDDSQTACDVMGWTMYFGLFYGIDYFNDTKYFLVDANIAHPNKPVLNTEFGMWSAEDNSMQTVQVKTFNETFKALKFRAPMNADGSYNRAGFLMGVTWWCIFDWYTAVLPNGFNSFGLYNMQRTTEKPVASHLKAAYLPYFKAGGLATDTEEEIELPTSFNLEQNYPNPFNPTTTISFSLPENSTLSLLIYNQLGEKLVELAHGEYVAGNHKVELVAPSNMSSGIYFYKLITSNSTITKKMILLK